MKTNYFQGIKVFNEDGEKVFPSYQKAAYYLECSPINVRQAYMKGCKCKGYWIDMARTDTTLAILNDKHNYKEYSYNYYDDLGYRVTGDFVRYQSLNDSPLGDFCYDLVRWIDAMDLNMRALEYSDEYLNKFIKENGCRKSGFIDAANLFIKIRNDIEKKMNDKI